MADTDTSPPAKRSSISRFVRTIWTRLTESQYTIIFVTLALLQFVVVFVLEFYVLEFNAYELAVLKIAQAEVEMRPGIAQNGTLALDGLQNRAQKYGEIVLEDIFFIVFVFYMLVFAIDAIVRQNVMQLFAHIGAQILAIIYSVAEIGESLYQHMKINNIREEQKITFTLEFIIAARNYQFGLLAILFVFTMIFAYLAFRLYQQFGWNIYKRIGADLTMQSMYRTYELFIMTLKLSFFFQFFFNVFWIVLIVGSLAGSSESSKTYLGIHCGVSFLNLASMVGGAMGARREDRIPMYFYLFVNVLMIANFGYIFKEFGAEWIVWDFAVGLAVIQSIVNIVLTYNVMSNFDRGLKNNIRSISSKKLEDHALESTKKWGIIDDDVAAPPLAEENSKWRIDDEEEVAVAYQSGYTGGYSGAIDGTTQGAMGY